MVVRKIADGGSRDLAKYGTFRSVIMFTSFLNERRYAVDSELEHILSLLMELDNRVSKYRPQPLFLDLDTGITASNEKELSEKLNGRKLKHRYAPDFDAIASGSLIILEAKHSARLEKCREKYERVNELLQRRSCRLLIYTEELLRARYLETNIRILVDSIFDTKPLSSNQIEAIRKMDYGHASYQKIKESLDFSENLMLEAIRSGELQFDIVNVPLNLSTKLTKGFGDKSHFHILDF